MTRKSNNLAVVNPPDANSSRPPEFSDDALALRFAEKHCDDLRYISSAKQWRRWNGTRWAAEKTLLSFDYARMVCRDATRHCADERVKKTLASAATVSSIERLARSDRRLAATVEQFDQHKMLLNTPDCTYDLDTGEARDHRRDDYLTMITSVGPGGDCPMWMSFLHRITNGDHELIRFLARVAGYALTGLTIEHAMFFLYGEGGNGKGVFTETLMGILNDYARPAPMHMFTDSRLKSHDTDVAGLQGARGVFANETEAGAFFAEAKVKLLTGGDRVSARKMRTDYSDFNPEFKLFLSGNRRPHLRTNSEAMRRRMHLIPFEITIPDQEKDPRLAQKLQAEWSGILRWAIDGCADWRRQRLKPPQRVMAATDSYFSSQDSLGDWITASLAIEAGAKAPADDLYGAYRNFMKSRGEEVGSIKDFGADLESKGFVRKRTGQGVRWLGMRLLET
jgi:putative DNA primase/helicase